MHTKATDLIPPRALTDAYTRRSFLGHAAQGAAVLTGASALASCGGSASHASRTSSGLPSSAGGGSPVRGGTLTVGTITGGTAETVVPILVVNDVDNLRVSQLFDTLFIPSDDLTTILPRLALAAERNSDATIWTITLRDGVRWHDGKPLTADDVVHTIRLSLSPQSYAGSLLRNINVSQVRKRGRLSVEVPLHTPDAQLPRIMSELVVVQDGASVASLRNHPVGTGPFKFLSFTPGSQSVFVANHDYWEDNGKPYVDRIIFNSSFTDNVARQNALLSGGIDLLFSAPWLTARQQLDRGQVTVFGSHSAQDFLFAMRVDKGPFADPRVRQAMKMLPNRQALIDGALAGFATVGTDLLGTGTPYFASDLKPVYDPEKARALLKAAGQENTTFTLQTSPVIDGMVQAATLFAAQAKAVGITVNVKTISPAIYYTPQGGVGSFPFRSDYYLPLPSLDLYYNEYVVAGAPGNETGWGNQPGGAAADRLTAQARSATDPTQARMLWHQVQKEQFDQGGLLIWANADYVHMASSRVRGVAESPLGYFRGGRLLDAWLVRT
jgi:peptide/nickel transport system substrate-binding protein